MKLRQLIMLLEYANEHIRGSVRYVECISADRIKLVCDDNSTVFVEWANGTDIVVHIGRTKI